MSYLVIDGSQGEGGGQILRTALTLSILTQTNIELINLRSKRKKPGLLRQHLTSVLAAQEICGATTEGVELGSTRIRFSPGRVKAGHFHFAIGTAGSTVLVCQTILPVLALAKEKSTVTFEGGTHNGMSPSLSFLEQSYLPILRHMGGKCDIKTIRFGFYPAGGGKWRLGIEPTEKLRPVHLLESGSGFAQDLHNCSLHALICSLPESIGRREIRTAQSILNWQGATSQVQDVVSPGPGNSFQLSIQSSFHRNVFEVVGELGVSAERVAKRAAGRVNKFLHSQAAVEEHLADQLLLLIALAGSGSFTTTQPSLHTITNAKVIEQMTGIQIKIEQRNEVLWYVYVVE
ncbi:RNA 3'-terminal phosphate cyclase [Vibrio sp. Of7-15]|uniref:RNA 3'-terminal phosphate cyclase n=1 Tax=Vibrio sp. Of7-15 TaxID=2724879 RepID=UPI001EF292F9|nr:RNA 3'-terminal phosphate cyclase [Vibrio sp. Of7-15]MCG7499171.1 RNA 3'-terminal phosphate cyclase [Vibrio sp. Of7-15]